MADSTTPNAPTTPRQTTATSRKGSSRAPSSRRPCRAQVTGTRQGLRQGTSAGSGAGRAYQQAQHAGAARLSRAGAGAGAGAGCGPAGRGSRLIALLLLGSNEPRSHLLQLLPVLPAAARPRLAWRAGGGADGGSAAAQPAEGRRCGGGPAGAGAGAGRCCHTHCAPAQLQALHVCCSACVRVLLLQLLQLRAWAALGRTLLIGSSSAQGAGWLGRRRWLSAAAAAAARRAVWDWPQTLSLPTCLPLRTVSWSQGTPQKHYIEKIDSRLYARQAEVQRSPRGGTGEQGRVVKTGWRWENGMDGKLSSKS